MPLKFVAVACAATALTVAVSIAAANTDTAMKTSPQCALPQFRQLDFWVGVWDVRWDASPGQSAGHGTNTITRELGNCVIKEHFEGGPSTGDLIGHSVSTYHAAPKLWRQTWVDNQGGYFALTGGPVADGTFVLENTRLGETSPYRRMVFEAIKPNSLTWRWQGSKDNGATWQDSWVIHYTRRAP